MLPIGPFLHATNAISLATIALQSTVMPMNATAQLFECVLLLLLIMSVYVLSVLRLMHMALC